MSNTTHPFIAVRCAYIRAGSEKLLCAVPLTLIGEQQLSDQELIERAERRLEDAVFDLRKSNSTVKTEIRVGHVSMKNPAYTWPSNIEDND